MSPSTSFFACIAVAASLCSSAHSQEPELHPIAVQMEWQTGQLAQLEAQDLVLTSEAPAGVTLPEDIESPLLFATISLSEAPPLHLVFDFDHEPSRFWADDNFDSNFADGEPLQWQQESSKWHRTLEVRVPFVGADKPIFVPLQLQCHEAAPAATLAFIAAVHKEGSVILGQRNRRVALSDATSKLDWASSKGIACYVDIDGDGELAARPGSHEHFQPGDRIQIGEQAWQYSVQGSNGAIVLLEPCTAAEEVATRVWLPTEKPLSTSNFTPSSEAVGDLLQRFENERQQPRRIRAKTIFALGRIASLEAFEALLNIATNDVDVTLRVAATRAMGGLHFSSRGSESLVRLTASPHESVATAAIASLYQLQHPQLGKLLQKLSGSTRSGIAAQAALYLGYLDLPETTKTLEALLKHKDADVRLGAYEGLRSLSKGPTQKSMLRAAQDNSMALAAVALLDLHAMALPEARGIALKAADRIVFSAYADAILAVLISAGDKVALQAAFDLSGREMSGQFAKRTALPLSNLRMPSALKVFEKNLKSKSKQNRMLAAQVYALIGGDIAGTALSKQLKREKDHVVVDLIFDGLGRSRSAAAIDVLVSKAKRRGPHRLQAIAALADCGLQEPVARAFLLGLLKSDYWEDRVLAIDAVGASGDSSLGPQLLNALQHERWQIRLAAVEALRMLRSSDWVSPLVSLLQVEQRLRVRQGICRTLFVITGQNPYMNPAAWQRWWNAAQGTFRMSSEIPKPHRSSGTISKSGFYGLSLDSDHVVFVIDKSGSMDAAAPADPTMERPGNRLDQAIANTVRSIGILRDGAMANVVMFSSGVRTWQSGLVPLKPSNRKGMLRFLDSQRPDGGTNLFDGLERALLQEGVDRILLLSDGEPSGGKYIEAEDILREVRRINQTKRIAIDCIALGMKSPLLERLALENGGRYIER